MTTDLIYLSLHELSDTYKGCITYSDKGVVKAFNPASTNLEELLLTMGNWMTEVECNDN